MALNGTTVAGVERTVPSQNMDLVIVEIIVLASSVLGLVWSVLRRNRGG